MRRLPWFVLGVLCCGMTALLAAALVLHNARGFPANHRPDDIEGLIARWARSESFPADARYRPNPVPSTPEVLAESRAHWADHCATCHANDGSGQTEMGRNTYPPAPDMRLPTTQRLTDGELFYIIQNGVRFTAMPAWGGDEHDATESWKLVRFIRHLPQVTDEEKRAMEKLNPKTPAEMKEEQEEEKFLEGEDSNHETMQHHHP